MRSLPSFADNFEAPHVTEDLIEPGGDVTNINVRETPATSAGLLADELRRSLVLELINLFLWEGECSIHDAVGEGIREGMAALLRASRWRAM